MVIDRTLGISFAITLKSSISSDSLRMFRSLPGRFSGNITNTDRMFWWECLTISLGFKPSFHGLMHSEGPDVVTNTMMASYWCSWTRNSEKYNAKRRIIVATTRCALRRPLFQLLRECWQQTWSGINETTPNWHEILLVLSLFAKFLISRPTILNGRHSI